MTVPDNSSARSWAAPRWQSLIGWAVTVTCLVGVVMLIDIPASLTALGAFSFWFVVPALLGLTLGYSIRIVRWAFMLRAVRREVRFRDCIVPFLGSIALNNVLPLRVGDVVRALVFPASIGVSRSAATSSIVLERLLDLSTLVLAIAVGAYVLDVDMPSWLLEGALVLAGLAMICLVGIVLASRPMERYFLGLSVRGGGLMNKAASALAGLLSGFGQMSRPGNLASLLGLSILVWICEAAVYYYTLLGIGLEMTPASGLFVMGFVTLSTLVPSSPGYVGPFQLAAVSVLLLLGSGSDQAAGFAIVVHLMLWVPTTIVGAAAMATRPKIFAEARSHAKGEPLTERQT